MDIKLYEYGPTRSARCRWTLLELEARFEGIEARSMFGTDELRQLHPLGKLPVAMIDGKVLFESGAICTYLADAHPDKGLIAAPGTWERALHDQWMCFTLAELEAWLWHSAKHSFVYSEDIRIAEVIPLNTDEFKKGAAVINDVVAGSDYLVDARFSVTDIIAAYALNWGRRAGMTGGLDALNAYLDRLYERPHCTLTRPE